MEESSILKKLYKGIVIGENGLANLFLLVIRLYWGWYLIVSGFGKWMHLEKTASYFSTLNIPMPHLMAAVVGFVEFFGGASLLLGLFARLFSILLVLNFGVAFFTAHVEATRNILNNPDVFTKEEAFLPLLVSFIILCFGSGFFSFDYWIERKAYGSSIK